LIAEQLASAGFMDKDIAYTSGIMHDIGRLALATVRPKEYSALLQTHKGSGESILEWERDLFGLDHCGIGHQLISDWKLPPDFEAVVFKHHLRERRNGMWLS
jgi:HD-like signal output (HDOD) protein